MEEKTPVVPEVGMGGTFGYGADCYPVTIIAMTPSRKTLTVQRDDYEPGPGHERIYGGRQEYVYSRNENGPTDIFTLRPDGFYKIKGGKAVLGLGYRRFYRDPHR